MAVHPLVVHFPLALLLAGNLALIYSLLRPWAGPLTAGRIALEGFINGTLGLGFAGLILSVATGLFDMQASPKEQARDGWLQVAIFHIICAVLLLPVNGSLLYRRFVIAPPLPETFAKPANSVEDDFATADFIASSDRLSIGLSVVALLLLAAAGWLGGALVYEYRVGVK